MEYNLTNEEIDLLIEAMDSWANRHTTGEIIGGMLEAMLGDKATPEAKAKFEHDRATKKIEQRLDQDTATLLKAKLIRIRQHSVTL
jgi:hypothetical protein